MGNTKSKSRRVLAAVLVIVLVLAVIGGILIVRNLSQSGQISSEMLTTSVSVPSGERGDRVGTGVPELPIPEINIPRG